MDSKEQHDEESPRTGRIQEHQQENHLNHIMDRKMRPGETTHTPGTVIVANDVTDEDGPHFKDQLRSRIEDPLSESQQSDEAAQQGDEAAPTASSLTGHKPIPTRPSPPPTPPTPEIHAVAIHEAVEIPLADAVAYVHNNNDSSLETRSKQQQQSSTSPVRLVILALGVLILLIAVVVGMLCGLTDQCQPQLRAFTSQDELYMAVDAVLELELLDSKSDQPQRATALRELLRPYGGSSMAQWNVQALTNFSHLFSRQRNPAVTEIPSATTTTLLHDLSHWDVSSATDLSFMFYQAEQWASDDATTWPWDTSRVVTMQSMFHGASLFNGNITSWNTGNVRSMARMFSDVWSFDQDISGWDMRQVVDCKWMVCVVLLCCVVYVVLLGLAV